MADEHTTHPLFSVGLPSDFKTNVELKALAAADGDIEPAPKPEASEVLIDLPSTSAESSSNSSNRGRGASGRYRDHLAAKKRTIDSAPYKKKKKGASDDAEMSASSSAAAADQSAPKPATDAQAAELSLLMGLWKPTKDS